MNDLRDSRSTPSPDLPPDITADLTALADASERDLTPLDRSLLTIRSKRPDSGLPGRNPFMATTEIIRRRPLVAAGLAALVLIALLAIPISYSRTTGHDVSITFTGLADDSPLRVIAGELKSALQAERVGLRAEAGETGVAYTLEAAVPARNRVNAAQVANAFAGRLGALGYHAVATTKPIVERVSGSVYAMARDLVINVSTDGKSAAQIEAEIRQQIEAAGIPGAQVSVTDEGSRRKVTVAVEHSSTDGQMPEPGELTLNLTKSGQTLGGDNLRVEQRIMRSHAGGETRGFVISDHGRQVSFEIANAGGMSDPALAAAVEAQLRQAGLDLAVAVEGGKVSIRAR